MRSKPITKSATATTITGDASGWTKVTYHSTTVVQFSADTIILDSGGFRTVTTLKRMNQAAAQFGLPYRVRQKAGAWSVWLVLKDEEAPFFDKIAFARKV